MTNFLNGFFGGGCSDNSNNGCFGDGGFIWFIILILLFCSGNNGLLGGATDDCNNGLFGGAGTNGCDGGFFWILILILLFCCCGNNGLLGGATDNNCGCSCNNNPCIFNEEAQQA